MSVHQHPVHRSAAVVAALLSVSLALPGAAGARLAGEAAARHGTIVVAPATTGPGTRDLRSPDTQDAARGAQPTLAVDLRSPDARDASAGTTPLPTARMLDPGRPARPVGVARVQGLGVHTSGRAVASVASAGGAADTGVSDVALVGGAAAALLLAGLGTAAAGRRGGTAHGPRHPVASR